MKNYRWFIVCVIAVLIHINVKAMIAHTPDEYNSSKLALDYEKQQAYIRHEEFKTFKPKNKCLLEQMRKVSFNIITVPEKEGRSSRMRCLNAIPLLDHVPQDLCPQISHFIEFLFGDYALKQLENIQTFPDQNANFQMLRWMALAHQFNVVPFYHNQRLYFSPNDPNTTILKGTNNEEYNLELLHQYPIDKNVELYQSLQALKNKTDFIRFELHEACIKNNEIQCAAIKKELSILEKDLIEANRKYQHYKNTRSKIVHTLATQYAIRLSPFFYTDLTPVILTLLKALKDQPELQTLIHSFTACATIENDKQKFEEIIVYPSAQEGCAQQALNKMYELFKHTKGWDTQPRYTAKVNDLIRVYQGQRELKSNSEYDSYFEQPNKIYYHPELTGVLKNYHLKHPKTGKDLV